MMYSVCFVVGEVNRAAIGCYAGQTTESKQKRTPVWTSLDRGIIPVTPQNAP